MVNVLVTRENRGAVGRPYFELVSHQGDPRCSEENSLNVLVTWETHGAARTRFVFIARETHGSVRRPHFELLCLYKSLFIPGDSY